MLELFEHKIFLLIVIITLGVILGKIKIRGFSFGMAAVMFIGLIFGHFGYRVDGYFTTLGLLLFVFTIGIQAGPGFINSFRKNGKHILSLAVILVFSASFIAWLSSIIFNFDLVVAIGLFAGALGSTPGLAAAIDATGSPDAAIGYGIAYPFGVIGFSILVKVFPKIFKINHQQEEDSYIKAIEGEYPSIIQRNIEVTNPTYLNTPLAELSIPTNYGVTVMGIYRNKKLFVANADSVFKEGDIVKVSGNQESVDNFKNQFGGYVNLKSQTTEAYSVNWFLVTNKSIVNKFYREIDLPFNYSASVSKIKRSGFEIIPNHNSIFRFGDRIQVVAPREKMDEISQLLGNDNSRLSNINLIPIFLGLCIGFILGAIKVPLSGDTTFSLGSTGGVLIAGLVLSALGKTGPVIWSLSGPSNNLLRELGLAIFLAGIGTKTGVSFVETFMGNGLTLFLIGVVITIVPAAITVFVGHKFFKMNFLTLMGATTGILTNSAGIGLLNDSTKTNACSIAYAMVFPFALILIIVFSQLLALLV